MTVESASYISQLDATLPAAGDQKSEGDDHFRLIKSVLKTQFPNFGTTAITPTAVEVNYLSGVTSAIQTQINSKAALASPALTGVPTAPTAAPGTNTTQLATTAFVAAVLPVDSATVAAASKATPVDADLVPLIDSAASNVLKKLTWANLKATLKTYFDTLYQAAATYVTPTTLNNGTLPASVTTLAASGNVTLGDASTDTLNVGNGGIIKDASGNVGIGTAAAGVFKLGFATNSDTYIGKYATTNHQAANATRLDLAFVDGSGYTGVSVRNSHDGTYSSQEVFVSTAHGGVAATTDQFKFDKLGNSIHLNPRGGMGYGTGAGGTVTQATSKATAVTLNKPTGQITMDSSALAASTTAVFTLTNSVLAETDLLLVSPVADGVVDPQNYNVWSAVSTGGGTAQIHVRNISGGSLSQAVKLRFAVLKSVSA